MGSRDTDHDELMQDIIRTDSRCPAAPEDVAPEDDGSQYLNLQDDEDGTNNECEEEIPEGTEVYEFVHIYMTRILYASTTCTNRWFFRYPD